VLEKSQYVDEEVLKKYLKGRQKLGSPDNLPMVFGQDREHERAFQSPHSEEMHLVYRVMLDLKQEMGDMKKMLGSLFYHSVHGGNVPKSLPAPSRSVLRSGQDSAIKDITELPLGDAPFSDVDMNEEDPASDERTDHDTPAQTSGERVRSYPESPDPGISGNRDRTGGPGGRPLSEEQKKVLHLFDSGDLPSIGDMEKFLIEQALEKYGGNRRKAARILGMSERTLYRKIDQYGLI
jgi:hypothetical protein